MSHPYGQLELTITDMKDPDLSHLVTQNQTLAAELAQCQADKDFVWSLWKKLQVANPDVTEAISLVIQREKEKSESKDRKVLEIIQVKDDRIEELQNIVTKQAEEISDALSKKVELTEKNSRLQLDNDRLGERVKSLEAQVRSEENREKSLEDTFRRTVEGTEKEKYELHRKVSRLTTDLEVAKSEKAHALNRTRILEERIRTLEQEVTDKMVKFEELVREVEDSSSRLTRYESQTSQQRRDLEFKNQELENVRKELKELWIAHNQLTDHSGQQADLIRQLQSLQQDTQKMLKNQEDAFSLESSSLHQMFTDVNARYETAKRTEADLRQQILELKKSLMDKDDIISSLHSQEVVYKADKRDSDDHRRLESQPEYSNSFLDIVQEVDAIGAGDTPDRRSRGRSLSRLRDLDSKIDSTLDVRRSRSLSPPTHDCEPRLEQFDAREVAQLQKALDLKTRQLDQMRRAHDNRLQRFQNLQASYRLAREELKTTEFGRKPKSKKPKRADPRSLQKENSDQVWNELSFFKAENRSLEVDKMSLQEEVDLLRVQTSEDAATIHELKLAILGQKEDFEFRMRRLNREGQEIREADKQLVLLKSQVQNKTVHIEKLERDIMNAVSQRDDFAREKSKLISQLVAVQQEASQHRMELADVKHQLQSVKHELAELHQSTKAVESDEDNRNVQDKETTELMNAVAASLLAKKRPKSGRSPSPKKHLNRSGDEGHDADNDEEWEEVPDSCESDSESESPRLGKTIARGGRSHGLVLDKNGKKVKPRRVPTHRPPPNRSSSQSPDKSSKTSRSRSPRWNANPDDHRAKREFATSPISFLAPTSSSPPTRLPAPSTAAPQPQKPSLTTVTVRAARRAADSRQTAALRQRISHLQQQVAVLKKVKSIAVQSEETLKETVAKLQAELTSVSGRLKASKQHVQKLQADVDKLQKEKHDLEASSAAKSEGKGESPGESQEVKVLEARLKVATSEASRQSATLRNLKTENEGLQEQVRNLQDRINHLERDVNQKRNLLESQRIKLKHAQDISKTDANNVEELQTKIKLLTEGNKKQTVQLESLKKRLSQVTKDKKQYEEKFLKVSLELEQKTKQLQEASSRRQGLESALSDLESSAQQQLHGLATQSEAAIDAAKDKLTAAQIRLTQFHSVVKILATELVGRTERARSKLKDAKILQEGSQREGDPSLQRAQDKARDILNLSTSDLEDIMSADGDGDSQESVSGDDRKADKRWMRKCEKLMNSRDDFVHPLISLLLQKMDERADLLIKTPR